MRRLLTGLVVAATTLALPAMALADNQEVADEIAGRLRDGGQLSNYKIGVKFQDGTAWLLGEVQSQQQMNLALKTVFTTPGVTRVVNDLSIASASAKRSAAAGSGSRSTGTKAVIRPARGATGPDKTSVAQSLERVIGGANRTQQQPAAKSATGRAERLASSFDRRPAKAASASTAQRRPTSPPRTIPARSNRPIPVAYIQAVGPTSGGPIPAYAPGVGGGVAPARYDQPRLPNYAWPSYSAYPNYAALTYPRQHSPTAWPFIGPFYPYPQVPLGWRKVTLEWDDGWWMLDFEDSPSCCGFPGCR